MSAEEQKQQEEERRRKAQLDKENNHPKEKKKKKSSQGFFRSSIDSFGDGLQAVLIGDSQKMTEGITAGIGFLFLKASELGLKISYNIIKEIIKAAIKAQKFSKEDLDKLTKNLFDPTFNKNLNNSIEKSPGNLKLELAEKGINPQKIFNEVVLEESKKLSNKQSQSDLNQNNKKISRSLSAPSGELEAKFNSNEKGLSSLRNSLPNPKTQTSLNRRSSLKTG